MAIALSVLVPCLPERLEHAADLLQALCRQAEGRPVEILGLLDNRWRSTGAKKNELCGRRASNACSTTTSPSRATARRRWGRGPADSVRRSGVDRLLCRVWRFTDKCDITVIGG